MSDHTGTRPEDCPACLKERIEDLRAELVRAWSTGYEQGINGPQGGHAINPYVEEVFPR